VGSRVAQLHLPFDTPPAAAELPRLRKRARELTEQYVGRAAAIWPAAAGGVEVSFALRGQTAGDACGHTGRIRYNEDLLVRYGDRFLEEIVPHEVAHVVVARAFRGRCRPHGEEWREVMRTFGAPARSCHAFETVPARRMKRIPYRCLCPDPHLLTLRAHRRIRRGHAEYRCRLCANVLVWSESPPPKRARRPPRAAEVPEAGRQAFVER
jgi:SprT protein